MNHSRTKAHKGAILVEFALVLPIILIVSLGAFEISRAIRLVGVASKLSFEMAKVALKDCFDGGAITGVQSLNDCLKEKQEGVQALATTILPESQIFISYYVVNDQENPANASAWANNNPIRYPSTVPDNLKSVTDYTTNFLNVPANFNALRLHRKILVGECFIPYQPLFGFIRLFLPFRTTDNYMYDSSIV